MNRNLSVIVLLSAVFFSCSQAQPPDTLRQQQERHLRNIRQLTFGGENAEAYFSFNEKRLSFQSTRDSLRCDQIFSMALDGTDLKQISNGKGRTTCAYYLPGDTAILYSSTHLSSSDCPPPPDFSKGYIWAIYKSYDIFVASADGNNIRQLTTTEGYDAEATISPRGDRFVFTSVRNGDLDIYTANLDGSDIRQVTSEIGYDGGAFFSPDGKNIVYRGYHPKDSLQVAQYQALLKDGFVRPSVMEIIVMDADGNNKKQLTNAGAASFAPYFHPDGNSIIFSSNMKDPKGRNFDLFMINIDGTGLEQITFNETFDGFPMFTRDGKQIVFCSNRNAKVRGETNVFIADWIP